MTILKNVTFACIDCELTGLEEKDRIIEVGVVTFTLDAILEEYETLLNPECPISPSALAIHHIQQSWLEGKPKIEEVLPKIVSLVQNYTIIGHGIAFDIEMILRETKHLSESLKSNKTIDTLRLARLYGDSPNNSLENLAKHFNVKIEGIPHRAMTDVKMNIAVFKHLVRRFKTVEEVFNVLEKPIKMKYMPLGKYKGRLFSEIPLDYLHWVSKYEFDQDLTYTLQQEIKKRRQGNQFSQASNPFLGL